MLLHHHLLHRGHQVLHLLFLLHLNNILQALCRINIHTIIHKFLYRYKVYYRMFLLQGIFQKQNHHMYHLCVSFYQHMTGQQNNVGKVHEIYTTSPDHRLQTIKIVFHQVLLHYKHLQLLFYHP